MEVVATVPRKLNIVTFSGVCPFNYSESLSGIETYPVWLLNASRLLSITLNPYQGLKLWRDGQRDFIEAFNYSESLSGIET